MLIREAAAIDKDAIISLYIKSQEATGTPDPRFTPPSELGPRLYARQAIKRLVTTENNHVIAHGLIEMPNPVNIECWRQSILHGESVELFELGGAFVDPDRSRQGIWSELLRYRLDVVRSLGAVPVSAAWSVNYHVKRTFIANGGKYAGDRTSPEGDISLFVF